MRSKQSVGNPNIHKHSKKIIKTSNLPNQLNLLILFSTTTSFHLPELAHQSQIVTHVQGTLKTSIFQIMRHTSLKGTSSKPIRFWELISAQWRGA
jgi:hypothetical protein